MRASLCRSGDEFEDGVAHGGRGGGPLIFFPPCCGEATMLEKCISDHRHQRMTVKALPESSLGVIETSC
jgi:hypothetical protein